MEDNDYEKKKKKHDEKSLLKALLSKLSERLKIIYEQFSPEWTWHLLKHPKNLWQAGFVLNGRHLSISKQRRK